MSSDDAPHGRIGYFGDYDSWLSALSDATPTTPAERIAATESTAQLMRRVRDGEIAYARDGVALDRLELPWALLAFLSVAALESSGRLSLVDIGGSLGVTYFQTRRFLAPFATRRWAIVDLPEVVACGRASFASDELSFHDSIAEARAASGARVALLSGVLQYVPEVDALLAEVARQKFDWILVDRTPLLDAPRSRITLQAVASVTGEISWPCRLLTRPALLAPFAASHDLVAEFPSFCDADETIDGAPLRHRGFALLRR